MEDFWFQFVRSNAANRKGRDMRNRLKMNVTQTTWMVLIIGAVSVWTALCIQALRGGIQSIPWPVWFAAVGFAAVIFVLWLCVRYLLPITLCVFGVEDEFYNQHSNHDRSNPGSQGD